MKKKFNILKLAPPARNFEEAAELVRLSENENIKFAVVNPNRFTQGFLALRQFIQQGRIEQISLITAVCTIGNLSQPAWQSNPTSAGGGVLLHNSYQIIDQLILNFAVPQQVYSLTTSQAGDRQQRLYLTEDTAVLTMKFTDTSFANLIASKAFGPNQEFLKVYGKDKILTASCNHFTTTDSLGQTNEQFEYDDDQLACMKKVLENFALSILLPDKNKLCSSGRENLNNMAVIESAYLSARTGFPEQPGRILKMEQLEPTNIWHGQ
jgi:predicted dehydrogenase